MTFDGITIACLFGLVAVIWALWPDIRRIWRGGADGGTD